MKIAYLEGERKLRIRDERIPEPKEGEVVLRVKVALTDGTDLKAYRRGHHLLGYGPFGHEYSGIIHSIGEGVEGFKEGDEVYGVNTAPCFACRYCKLGKFNFCETLFSDMVVGTYAEYVRIPARVVRRNLFHKPKHLPFETAPILEPFSCVWRAYMKIRELPFRRVLIYGSGSIGAMFYYVLSKHTDEIEIVGRGSWRARYLKEELGMNVVHANELEGRYDLIVDTTGNVQAISGALEFLENSGSLLVFSGVSKGEGIHMDLHEMHYSEWNVLSSFHHTPEDVRGAKEFLEKNHSFFRKLITHRFKLEDINEAFRLLDSGVGLKIAILP